MAIRTNQKITNSTMNFSNDRRTNEKNKTSFIVLTKTFEAEINSRNLTAKTIHDYIKNVENFFNYCVENGINYFEDISLYTLVQYVSMKTATVSPENSRRFISYYSVFCSSSKKYFPNLNFNMIKDVNKPQIRKKKRFAYSDDDVKQIYALIKKNGSTYFSYRMQVIITLMLKTGVRSNECLSLRTNDLFFDENKIFVEKGKMNKQRSVPMTESLKKILRKYLIIRNDSSTIIDSTYLFLDQNNAPLSYNAIRIWVGKHIKPYLNLSQNRKWGFHQFRVKFATEYYRKTKDIKSLQYILGHAELSMTMKYVAMVEEEVFCSNPIEVNNLC